MSNRTEPTKRENEQDIAALKRETRGEPMKFIDAVCGVAVTEYEAYKVVATGFLDGQRMTVAIFPYDNFDGGKRRETARIFAEELADRLNNA
jgi:hypothetical protein